MDVYGLIGNPVGHSVSPALHQAGFDALEIDAAYVTFEPPSDAGARAITAAQTLGVGGLNVTIPFKEDVLEAVTPDALAREVGAVNTVVFNDGVPSGFNTDVEGAVRALRHHDVSIAGQDALIVGAGGAGRGIAFGLANEGASVRIANRTVERAKAIAADIEGTTAHRLNELTALVRDADLLVNATSVGMEADESIVPSAELHGDLVVMDAVYRPLETRLLADARAAGATTIDGAWMLLYQGIAAFERWTGREAPVEVMNRALRDSL